MRVKQNVGGLATALQIGCEREHDDVWAVQIAHVVLEYHAGADTALLITMFCPPELDEINISDDRRTMGAGIIFGVDMGLLSISGL